MIIKRVSQREMEKYILGELHDQRLSQLEKYSKENLKFKKEIEIIKNSNKNIFKRYPPKQVVEKIFNGLSQDLDDKEKSINNKPVFFRRMLYISPALVLAILLIFLNIYLFKGQTDKPVNGNFQKITRSKGLNSAYLIVFKLNNGRIEQLKNRGRAKAGDTLQLVYSSPRESYGVIFSIDGRGNITLHFPNDITQSTALKQNRKVKLPTGFLLDDAPDFERFFFLTSNSKIYVENILEKVKNQTKNLSRIKKGNFIIDKDLKQYSIIIRKGGK